MLNKEEARIACRGLEYMLEADNIADKRFLSNEERADAIRAKAYAKDLADGEMIGDYWTTDDVRDALSRLGEDDPQIVPEAFSDEQARNVLARMEADHDAQYGYTWDGLEGALRDVLEGKEA